MTFPTGVVEMKKYSDEELKAMLAESREVSKHSRTLDREWKSLQITVYSS